MIEVRDLVYEYPTKRALDGVSLTVQPQTITALVGPNGAGKTTLLRCLAALEAPYSGTVTINGLDTRESPRAIHAHLGYLPDFFGLYDELSVRRCLLYAAWSHGIAPALSSGAVEKAARRVGLVDRLETKAGELSRGLRQRLAIGRPVTYIDATHLTPVERSPYVRIAQWYGCELEAVFFDVPVEVCIARNRTRGRVVPEEIIRGMAEKMVMPTASEGFVRISVVT